MLRGEHPRVTAEATQRALDEAEADHVVRRDLGFGVIGSQRGSDSEDYDVVVTDGTRQAAIVARLTGTLLARLSAEGEDPVEHLRDRLRGAAGSLHRDQRYENLLLHHPLTFPSA